MRMEICERTLHKTLPEQMTTLSKFQLHNFQMYQHSTPALHLHTHLNERGKRENNASAQATLWKGSHSLSHYNTNLTPYLHLCNRLPINTQRGQELICLAGKTPLGMYLRRCKEVILNDRCVDVVSPYPYSFNRSS